MNSAKTIAGRIRPSPFLAVFILLALTSFASRAQPPINIYEDGAGYIAFEATTGSTSNTPPYFFATVFDPILATNVIYAAGQDTAAPRSYITYYLVFTTPEVYTLYYRWRADTNYTAANPNAANSFFLPNNFGPWTDADDFTASSSALETSPADAAWHITAEPLPFVATPADVETGTPTIFRIGLHKSGMLIERFVLSTNPNLTETDFEQTPDSPTTIGGTANSVETFYSGGTAPRPAYGGFSSAFQGFESDNIAFEAELGALNHSGYNFFEVLNDPAASGSAALFTIEGVDSPTNTAVSFASFNLYFATPGDYHLYSRWKAETNWPGLPTNSIASFLIPSGFGNLTNRSDFVPSVISGSPAPTDALYHVAEEPGVYTVTTNQAASGTAVVFTIGTGTPGLVLDRFVLSLDANLTETAFNSRADSVLYVEPPNLIKVVGSSGLTNFTLTFNQPLHAPSIIASNIGVTGGLIVLGAVLDTNTFRDIHVWTTPQTEGQVYQVSAGGIANWVGIGGGGSGQFAAWVEEAGWITQEFYESLPAGTLDALTTDPKFPDYPDLEAISVTGSTMPPTLHVIAQDSADYEAAPGYVRASSTNASAPQKGNYFEFDNLQPRPDGGISITISAEPAFVDNGYPPIFNGLQLVSVLNSNRPPALVQVMSNLNPAPQLFLYWGNDAAGWRLQTTTNLATGASDWTPVTNVPSPLPSSGAFTNMMPDTARFYRLAQ